MELTVIMVMIHLVNIITILLQLTSIEFINFEQQFNDIMKNVELKDDDHTILEEEYEMQVDGLYNENNSFRSWSEEIYNESQEYIREGSGINAMYVPTIVPLIIKCVNLLPLWSGLMIPIFKYGNLTSSSASVESSFKKLKIITFKDIHLPTNIDTFLERHITSLRGSSLFHSASQQ